MIKVYVKINEENIITQIESSIFLSDITDFIEIDNGTGDKFVHAQSQYLKKGLTDKYGRYNYKLIDSVVVEIPEEEKPKLDATQPIMVEQRVEALENALLEMVLGGTI